MMLATTWFANLRNSISLTLFIVTLVILVGAVFVWAAFIRKPSRPHHHHHRHHWRRPKPAESETAESSRSLGLFRRKRHRRRRKNRPANPTLAETGGLPPVRSEDSGSPRTSEN